MERSTQLVKPSVKPPFIGIACGGTGGHLFPGLAVAQVLEQWGCEIALLISKKEVDQDAVKATGMQVVTLPAVALQNWQWPAFLRGCWRSYRICLDAFGRLQPRAVLAMGGFTSAPPVLAGKRTGAATFLHESNSVPGRANRWLSPWVDEVFIGFPSARQRLYSQCIRTVGTPVRSAFKPGDPTACRMALGLSPDRPVLLIMGGSQGASGINRLVLGALPILARQAPSLQYLHLTGADECQKVRSAYDELQLRAVVRPFLTEMDLGLGASTLLVNRAGASSLAEIAAVGVPAVLIPYPHATDDHQLCNARAVAQSGAALLLEQALTTSEKLAETILKLFNDAAARGALITALRQWHTPDAAEAIARYMFHRLGLVIPELMATDEAVSVPASSGRLAKGLKGATFKLSSVPPSL